MSGKGFYRRLEGRERRKRRVRKKISGTAERQRLSVFRSNRHFYCQVIDDAKGHTLASASTLEKDFKQYWNLTKTEQARKLGEIIAKRAIDKGITSVVFDRDGYKYHGRVKALAEAARENGLIF